MYEDGTKFIISIYNTDEIKAYLEVPGYDYPPFFTEKAKIHIVNRDSGQSYAYTATWKNDSAQAVKQIGFHANQQFIKDLERGEVLILRNSVIGGTTLDLSDSRVAINNMIAGCRGQLNTTLSSEIPIQRDSNVTIVQVPVPVIPPTQPANQILPPPITAVNNQQKSEDSNWFSIPENLSGCQSSTSPAEHIRKLHSNNQQYQIDEIKDSKGELLRVTIKFDIKSSGFLKMDYYKSLEDCKKALEDLLPSRYQ